MRVFFFNDTATTEIYTLSLHDALPICLFGDVCEEDRVDDSGGREERSSTREPLELLTLRTAGDRKSTRLNSSHANISYAVFCLKKKINLPHLLHHSNRKSACELPARRA